MPSIELLIQKLRKLELKRSSAAEPESLHSTVSPPSQAELGASNSGHSPVVQGHIFMNSAQLQQQNSASYILEQVIKRLEQLQSTR
jgi:hypothetical protein